MRLGIGVDAHKVERLVVVAWVDDDTSITPKPHAQAVVSLDSGFRLRILEGDMLGDEEAESRLTRG